MMMLALTPTFGNVLTLPLPAWKSNMSGMQQKTAAIIVIGNEILTGKSEDQNASYLIKELYKLGVALRRIVIIPDDMDDIINAVRECSARFDYVFTSGGIGPTHDDLTIPSIARAFHREMVRHPELEGLIRGYFGVETDEKRLRLADVPAGSQLVGGTSMNWPVVATENVYILPGVPEFFRRKFECIRDRFQAEPFYVRMVFTREEELDIATRLDEVAAAHRDVEIGSYPVFGSEDYRVKITIEAKEKAAVEGAQKALLDCLNPKEIVRTESNYA
jgi:molybdenum cofactor synthesis domain-containing protein